MMDCLISNVGKEDASGFLSAHLPGHQIHSVFTHTQTWLLVLLSLSYLPDLSGDSISICVLQMCGISLMASSLCKPIIIHQLQVLYKFLYLFIICFYVDNVESHHCLYCYIFALVQERSLEVILAFCKGKCTLSRDSLFKPYVIHCYEICMQNHSIYHLSLTESTLSKALEVGQVVNCTYPSKIYELLYVAVLTDFPITHNGMSYYCLWICSSVSHLFSGMHIWWLGNVMSQKITLLSVSVCHLDQAFG